MSAGRPRKFDNPEQLNDLIKDYFDSITTDSPRIKNVIVGYKDKEKEKPIYEQQPVMANNGEQIVDTIWLKRPSILGLCRHIGTNRQTLLNYENKKEYFDTIKSAKEIIEQYVEEELFRGTGQVTGIIFNLKNNFGWADKQEIEHKGDLNVTHTQQLYDKYLDD